MASFPVRLVRSLPDSLFIPCGSFEPREDSLSNQSFHELPHVLPHSIDVGSERRADSKSDLALVTAGGDEFEDHRTDGIEAVHLSPFDIQENGSVLRPAFPDRAGDCEHPTIRSSAKGDPWYVGSLDSDIRKRFV